MQNASKPSKKLTFVATVINIITAFSLHSRNQEHS